MNTHTTAHQWRDLGVATIPILARSKVPALDSWKPYQTRLPTDRELRTWFLNSGYGLAVITGWTDLVVVDWDDAWLYSAWLSGLNGQYSAVSRTYRVQTRRGWHLYFRCPNAQNWKGPGVDVKAAGGYVLAPPTIHPTGHRYAGVGEMGAIQAIGGLDYLLPGYAADDGQAVARHERVPPDPFDDAMRAPQHVGLSAADIKARIHWPDIVPGLTTRRGKLTACCPIHSEKSPSFVVYPDGYAHCYGCGFHGDVIDGWAAMHKLTTVEAMIELASR
jgi:hypothetical protein